MTTEIQSTIATQINARELVFAGFSVYNGNQGGVTIQKGHRAVNIVYNGGSDLYDVTTYTTGKDYRVNKETMEGLYWEDLQSFIEAFFPRFKYVMNRITAPTVSA